MKTRVFFLVISCSVLMAHKLNAQVAINTETPHESAVFHIEDTDRGIIIPRVTDTFAVNNPANGLIIYNTTRNNLSVFDGQVWQELRPFPGGGIIMWSGAPEDIPQGWALCNGYYYNPANSAQSSASYQPGWIPTPNLSGKFIVSYDIGNPEYNTVGNTGGENITNLTVAQLPEHNHMPLAADGEHTHTVTTTGSSHTHTTEQELGYDGNTGHYHYAVRNNSGSSNLSSSNTLAQHTNDGDWEEYRLQSGTSSAANVARTSRAGHTHNVTSTGSEHTHGVTTTNSAHTHALQPAGDNQPIENRPAYFVLAFIMKL